MPLITMYSEIWSCTGKTLIISFRKTIISSRTLFYTNVALWGALRLLHKFVDSIRKTNSRMLCLIVDHFLDRQRLIRREAFSEDAWKKIYYLSNGNGAEMRWLVPLMRWQWHQWGKFPQVQFTSTADTVPSLSAHAYFFHRLTLTTCDIS